MTKWTAVASIPQEGFECYWIEDESERAIGAVHGPQNSQNEAIAKLWADSDRILDALENLVIAIGMGFGRGGGLCRGTNQKASNMIKLLYPLVAITMVASFGPFVPLFCFAAMKKGLRDDLDSMGTCSRRTADLGHVDSASQPSVASVCYDHSDREVSQVASLCEFRKRAKQVD